MRSNIPAGTTYVQMRTGGWEAFQDMARSRLPEGSVREMATGDVDVLMDALLNMQRRLMGPYNLVLHVEEGIEDIPHGMAAFLVLRTPRFDHVLTGPVEHLLSWLREMAVSEVMAL